MKILFPILLLFVSISCSLGLLVGCANIIPPGGGPKDTLPPIVVSAFPKDSTLNFKGKSISINFNEYIDLQNVFENIVVSPLPKNLPTINNNYKTVNIKLKDTLEPNTTYSINFGNAIRDINEGNIFKDFTYTFSTGNTLDTNSLSGKVVIAETGLVDSTLIVVLHKNTADSAVAKERPRYMAKLNGQGKFSFRNLPAGTFALYAIPNDYNKQYEDTTKPFAFSDSLIKTPNNKFESLYAYAVPKTDTIAKPKTVSGAEKKAKDDVKLKIQPLIQGVQDLLSSLEVGFNKPVKTIDTTKIVLTDTNNKKVNGYTIKFDRLKNSFVVEMTWLKSTGYKLLIDSTAITDSAGGKLSHNDTIAFITKKPEDYGSVKLQFLNIDLSKNPVLQILQNDKIIESVLLTEKKWTRKLFNPGDYDMRILYDNNKNGKWDPGHFFGNHRQPEIVITLNTKLSVRANWDNEKDITLQAN